MSQPNAHHTAATMTAEIARLRVVLRRILAEAEACDIGTNPNTQLAKIADLATRAICD